MMELGITLGEARGHLNTRKMTGKATRGFTETESAELQRSPETKTTVEGENHGSR